MVMKLPLSLILACGILSLPALARSSARLEERLQALERRLQALERQQQQLQRHMETYLNLNLGTAPVSPEEKSRVFIGKELGVVAEHFSLTLGHIERDTSQQRLNIAVVITNTDTRTRYLWLPKTFRQSTSLIDQAGKRYTIRDIEGLSARRQPLRPHASRVALFTFPLAEGFRSGRIESLWYTPDHFEVVIPFTLPETPPTTP
jgi:hypothetical protein